MEPIQISIPKKKIFRLIGQGTYGCTIHPGINCATQRIDSVKYVSKLQIKDAYSKSEIEMGKIIQKIPNYSFFFAPILEHCNVHLSTIDLKQIEQCKPIVENKKENSDNTFISNKIRYLGNKTFGKFFYGLLGQRSNYLQKLLESHIYLLNSLKILNRYGILHLDIKENNIMYDKTNDVFIIIDFGFSIESKTIQVQNYIQATQPFGKNTDAYHPWCIEIHLLSYIARYSQSPNVFFQQTITNINIEELKRRCTLFVKKNIIFKTSFFSENESQQFELALHKWVDGFKGKMWKDVWGILVSSHTSWDNYGLAVMYLFELYDSNEPIYSTNYIDILKRIIMAFPEKRSNPEETSQEIKKIFRILDKTVLNKMINIEKPILKKEVKERKDRRTFQEVEEDARLRKQ